MAVQNTHIVNCWIFILSDVAVMYRSAATKPKLKSKCQQMKVTY